MYNSSLSKRGSKGEDSFLYDMDRLKRKKLNIPYTRPKLKMKFQPYFEGRVAMYIPVMYERPGWIRNNNDEMGYRNKVKIT